jgi:hypothetical protein
VWVLRVGRSMLGRSVVTVQPRTASQPSGFFQDATIGLQRPFRCVARHSR